MNKLIGAAFLLSMMVLGGCATTPQPPVTLAADHWQQPGQRVGIYVAPIKEPEFYMEGDVRLLDYAINAAVMAPVMGHFSSLDLSDYTTLSDEIRQYLEGEGVIVRVLAEDAGIDDAADFPDPNKEDTLYFADKDFTRLKSRFGIDQLLLIKPKRVGVARPYHSFVPLSNPRAVFELNGELVDLNDNRLLWFAHINHAQHVRGNWDEPPVFPGLTNGFYAALESAKQEVHEHLHRRMEQQAKVEPE